MLRTIVLKKYINDPIHEVIGHNASVYIRDMILTLFFLVVAYGIWLFVNRMIPDNQYVSLIFGLIGLYLLGRFLIDFLNQYLDAIALTPNGVAIYRREWILEFKTELFERHKIELISYEQNSLWDKIFMKGDIVISLDYNTSFTFENISHPQKKVANIMMAKHRHQRPDEFDQDLDEENKEKFDILVETLGEVIQDYMKKDKPRSQEPSNYENASWSPPL